MIQREIQEEAQRCFSVTLEWSANRLLDHWAPPWSIFVSLLLPWTSGSYVPLFHTVDWVKVYPERGFKERARKTVGFLLDRCDVCTEDDVNITNLNRSNYFLYTFTTVQIAKTPGRVVRRFLPPYRWYCARWHAARRIQNMRSSIILMTSLFFGQKARRWWHP